MKKTALVALVLVWSASVAGGFALLGRYAGAAGEDADVASFWPAGSRIARSAKPTLVVVAHAECPCTRATLRELEKLASRIDADVWVVFANRPSGSALEQEAARFAHVIADPVEAKRFGAKTSGQTYLYASGGKLLFAGGITPARGHEGDTDAQRRIRSLVRAHVETLDETDRAPVYGCPTEGKKKQPS